MPESTFTARGDFSGLDRSAQTSAGFIDKLLAKVKELNAAGGDTRVGVNTGQANRDVDAFAAKIAALNKSRAFPLIGVTGAREAEAQVNSVQKRLDDLQKRVYEARLRADTAAANRDLDRTQAKIDRWGRTVAQAKADVGTKDVTAKLALATAEMDKFGKKKSTATADLDNRSFLQKVGQMQEKADSFGGGFIKTILTIIGLVTGPLSVALVGAAVALGGLVSATVTLGLGFGALGLVAAGPLKRLTANIGDVLKAQTAVNDAVTSKEKLNALRDLDEAMKKIPPDQRPVVASFLDLKNRLDEIGKRVMPILYSAILKALDAFKQYLPFIEELATATAKAVETVAGEMQRTAARVAKDPNWQQIIHMISAQLPYVISVLATSVANLAGGFVKLGGSMNFQQAAQWILGWIETLTRKFDEWAGGKGQDELRRLMDYLHQNGPQLAATAKDVAKALGDLVVALAKLPLTGAELDVLRALAQVLDTIVKNPIGAWAVGLLFLAGGITKVGLAGVGAIDGLGKFAGKLKEFGGLATSGEAGIAAFGARLGLIGILLAADTIIILEVKKHWQEIVNFFKSDAGWVVPWLHLLALYWHNLWDIMQQVADWIRTAFIDAWHVIVNVWHGVIDSLHTVVDAFKTAWHGIEVALGAVKDIVLGVVHFIVDAFNTLKDILLAVWHFIQRNWETIWRVISIVVLGFLGIIVDAIVTHFNEIKEFILGVLNFIWHSIIEPIWNGIRTTIQVVMGVILAVISAVWNTVRDVILAVVNFIWHSIIEPIWNAISGFLDSSNHTILNIITTVWNFIRDTINTVVNFIWHSIIEPIWNGIRGTIESVVNFIWHGVIQPVFDGISGTIRDVVTTLSGWLEGAWQGISDFTSRIWGGIRDAIIGAITSARDVGKGIINGIIDFINAIVSGVKSVASFIGIPGADKWPDPAIHQLAAGGVISHEVKAMAGGGCLECEVGRAMAGGGSSVGPGFATNKPRAIVGEGGPYKEYVIPTDPKFKGNALSLLGGLLADLGMRTGGVLGNLRGQAEQLGSLVGWRGTGAWWDDIPGAGIVKGAISGIGDLGKWIIDKGRGLIAAGIEELAKTFGWKWPETPMLWPKQPPVAGFIGGGTANKGVQMAIDFVRGKEQAQKAKGGGAGIGGAGPPAPGVCQDWVRQGLAYPGANPGFGFDCMMARVMNESGCNPRIVNTSDWNAAAGHPSGGVAQFIPATFASQSCPGCTDFWNPVCQVCASSHCSPGNCGHGGYGCQQGAVLGQGITLPDPLGLPDPKRQGTAYVKGLEKVFGVRMGRSTGEKMLLKELGVPGFQLGGIIGGIGAGLAPQMHFARAMGSAPIEMKQGGTMGRSVNMGGVTINYPTPGSSEDGMQRTVTKMSYQGLFG